MSIFIKFKIKKSYLVSIITFAKEVVIQHFFVFLLCGNDILGRGLYSKLFSSLTLKKTF